MKEIIKQIIYKIDPAQGGNTFLLNTVYAIAVVVLCVLVYFATRKLLLSFVHGISKRTKTTWDDHLVKSHFFKKLSSLLPFYIFLLALPGMLSCCPDFLKVSTNIVKVVLTMNFASLLISFINALQSIVSEKPSMKGKPLQSYSQLLKIIVFVVFGIWIFSILTGETPMFFLTAMGAMSAIVLLIFKDTILGFVGSIQLASNDMVRIGDWITMERYGADGNVEEINLATIKVQNFDNTITTIPTYALISDSFKNWRGMEESKGRRVKRALNIKISTIHFCSQGEIDNFKKIRILKEYIEDKDKELAAYNSENDFNQNEVNGRRLTNIGVFRKYVETYLLNHHLLNKDLTCMVRQLPPTEKGLPIEIYAFSKDKEWVIYEGVMSDIFDHVMAIVPSFNLEVFQSPTGSDIVKIGN
jgi:miniconductance mechanosensitive channel